MPDQRDISEKLKHSSIHFLFVHCQTRDGCFFWIEVDRSHAYTWQLSPLKRDSRAFGSKTSILHSLTPIPRDQSLSSRRSLSPVTEFEEARTSKKRLPNMI